jgi:hypothetical protein
MPDWVTHLGMAYVAARVVRVQEVSLVLLGAVLPDVMVPALILKGWLNLPLSWNVYAYLAPFQSLTMVSLFALAIALLHKRPGYCFLLVLGGALTHFALDVLETDFDCGVRVFYPFSFLTWAPGWLTSGSVLSLLLLGVSALALTVALRQRGSFAKVTLQCKNLRFVVPLVALALLLPLLTRQALMSHNVHFLAFLTNPTAWQGRSVDLCSSRVVSTSPLEIEEFNRRFELVTEADLGLGEKVSVRGVYRAGKIYPTRLYIHRGFSEVWVSLVGLVALLALWFWP